MAKSLVSKKNEFDTFRSSQTFSQAWKLIGQGEGESKQDMALTQTRSGYISTSAVNSVSIFEVTVQVEITCQEEGFCQFKRDFFRSRPKTNTQLLPG